MKKILIVDDDVDIIDLLENRLRSNNYDVIFTNDGISGYKKAITEQPDLIIMDIMMPQMPGEETIKLLKSNEKTQQIPILIFTALAKYLPNGAELDQIKVEGKLYPTVTKPFEPNKLLSAIKMMLDE